MIQDIQTERKNYNMVVMGLRVSTTTKKLLLSNYDNALSSSDSSYYIGLICGMVQSLLCESSISRLSSLTLRDITTKMYNRAVFQMVA